MAPVGIAIVAPYRYRVPMTSACAAREKIAKSVSPPAAAT
jgi:hypothetical protein